MVLLLPLLNLTCSEFLQTPTHRRCFGKAAVITDFINNVIQIFIAASTH